MPSSCKYKPRVAHRLLRLMRAAFVIILGAFSPASALPPGFYPLGELPGGEVHSHGYALSADGSVAVGISVSLAGPEAFRWTAETGMVGIGDLPGGGVSSSARDVSADGSVIVGVGSVPGEQSFRWTADGGMTAIAPSGGATGVSGDGAVVVGVSGGQAYRWTEAEGPIGLGDLPGGGFNSIAVDVSATGTGVVGYGQSASGTEAFRWTQGMGMVGLGDLPGGAFHSEARGVSADGSVIAGFSQSGSGQEAFRWTAEIGMVGLGDLPGGGFFSSALDVSADGNIVVGHSETAAFVREPFVWDAAHGMRSLRNMLGLDFSDFVFLTTEGVSDDGTTLIGRARHHDGTNEAWIAVLPEPSTLALLAIGGLVLARRRHGLLG